MPGDDELFSTTEVLEGFSGKRARLLLFQIERYTAYLMTQARQVANPYLAQQAAEEQELVFFEALAQGREAPVHATIRDLERYAPQWQFLVPSNPALRASLAYLLGQKYSFSQRDVPHIRQALGLDSEEVQRVFERRYRQPLDTIYKRQPGLLDWGRWRWSNLGGWLERLPPFWIVFSLVFADTVGSSILALPIALAGVGPLAGVGIVAVMGVFNVLTITAWAEAIARNGSMRFQGGSLFKLAHDYLGRPGSLLLTITSFIDCFLLLLVYYLGISLTLADTTSVPPEVWAGGVFLLGLFFVRQKTLIATVTGALLIGAINIGLILLLSILTLRHVRIEHLSYIHLPFVNGNSFEPALVSLIIGIVLSLYCGQFMVNSCARMVLQRDPGGRSLIWGAIAAVASAIVLYVLWTVAVNGVFAPQTLTGLAGTAVTPLGQLLGPVATLGGTLLALLTMGIGSVFIGLAIFFTVQGWIPGRTRHILVLGRRQGKAIFVPRGKANASLTLTYLGLKGTYPQFRLDLSFEGETRRFEVEVKDSWEASTTLAEFMPKFSPHRIQLTLKVVSAGADTARVQLVSTMRMRYEGNLDRLGFDLLEMTDSTDTTLIGWLSARRRVSIEEVAHFLDQSQEESKAVLNDLVKQGVLLETREQGQTWYQIHFVARRKRQATAAIWQALDDFGEVASREYDTIRLAKKGRLLRGTKELVQGNYGRFWLAFSPLILIFLLCEWSLLKSLVSFTELLDFVGILALPVEIGVFPVLLLYAGRRKGEYIPGFVPRFLAHPVMVGIIYLISVGILFLHGLFIWQNMFQRAIAILMGIVTLAATYMMIRRGAFARRLVIEVRQDPGEEGHGLFTVTDTGQFATHVRVELSYTHSQQVHQTASGSISDFSDLRSVTVHLTETKAQELRIWLHHVTLEGHSENLPALVKMASGKEIRNLHLDGSGNQFVFPLRNDVKKASRVGAGEPSQLEVEVQLVTSTT